MKNKYDSNIGDPEAGKLIQALKKFNGAMDYDGDASCQVMFGLANGETLRIGITDDDVGTGKLWVDQYQGLAIIGKDGEMRYV